MEIDIKKLMKYPFARDFAYGKATEKEFIRNLREFFKGPDFRKETGIESLDNETLSLIIKGLNDPRLTRRSFLKWFGIVAGAAAFGGAGYWLLKSGKPTDAKSLYSQMLRISDIKPIRPPLFSKNMNSPTIIICSDIHGREDEKYGWKANYKRLELIRKNFGINFVGVEGWAGHEADRKRGFRLLGGENLLIEALIKDANYNVVGLEDSYLLEIANKFVVMVFHRLYQRGVEVRETRDLRDSILSELRINPTEENLVKIDKELKKYNDGHYLPGEVRHPLSKISQERDSFAVKVMVTAIAKYKIKFGVMVFGKVHVDGIIEKLKKLQDASIIVIGEK